MVFEIYIDGYLSWSNMTDDLIKWIEAPSVGAIETFLKRRKISLAQETKITFLIDHLTDGIDVILAQNGNIIRGKKEIDRWAQQTQDAKDFLAELTKNFYERQAKEDEATELAKLTKKERKKKKRELRRQLKQQKILGFQTESSADVIQHQIETIENNHRPKHSKVHSHRRSLRTTLETFVERRHLH